MKSIWRIFFYNALIVLCFLGYGPAARAENRALLVGIGQYEMGLRLPGIGADIRHMETAVSLMGFEAHQVRVLMNEQATLDSIRQAVQEWLVKGVTPRDRVLFYFSGHGSQIKDKNGDETDGADEVLLPYNASLQDNTLDHVLVDEEFDRILNAIPANIVLVFIDACHSGTATRHVFDPADGYVPKFFDYKGMPVVPAQPDGLKPETVRNHGKYIALSACRDDEEALSSGKGSLMTRGILNALDEAVLTGRGLTMDAFKTKTTGFIAKSLAVSNRTQHPQITGNISLAETYIIGGQIHHLWNRLEALAAEPGYGFGINAPERLVIDDTLSVSCRPGRPGYLNIIMIDSNEPEAVVLFPNRFTTDNKVTADTLVTIPQKNAPFLLRAQSPPGKSMILAVHTREKIDLFSDGVGDPMDDLRKMSGKSLEDMALIKKQYPSNFSAAVFYIEVVKK